MYRGCAPRLFPPEQGPYSEPRGGLMAVFETRQVAPKGSALSHGHLHLEPGRARSL